MTYQKRYFADFKDILAIRLVCPAKTCQTTVSLKIASTSEHIPEICPRCRTKWWPLEGIDLQQVSALLKALAIFAERDPAQSCRIQFEMEPPE